MGIITNFANEVVKGVAKDVAMQTTIVAAGAIEKGIDKLDNGIKSKATQKIKKAQKNNSHFIISYEEEVGKGIFKKGIKKKYLVENDVGVCSQIEMTASREGLLTLKVYDNNKQLLAMLKEQDTANRAFITTFMVSEFEEKLGEITVAKSNFLCKFTSDTGETWQISPCKDKEYKIVHLGKEVGHCSLDLMKLNYNSIVVDFKETEAMNIIMYLAVAFFQSSSKGEM